MMKSFKQPDLNAPRYKVTRMAGMNIHFYRRFFKKFPKYKDTIDNNILDTIITTFNINMRDQIITTRDGAEFPEGLGYSFVGSCPAARKKNNVNKVLSIQHNQHIKHRNFDSDSFIAKIFYTNYANKYKFKMRELWMFKGCREFTRAVSQEYRENWKRYVEVDSFMHIRKLYQKHKNREIAIKLALKPSTDYNEFDLN